MLNPISFMKAMRNPQKFLEEITKNNEVMSTAGNILMVLKMVLTLCIVLHRLALAVKKMLL